MIYSLKELKNKKELSSVVFPNPAEAERIVSLRDKPVFNFSIRRGRNTSSGRDGGMASLVFRIGSDTKKFPGLSKMILKII